MPKEGYYIIAAVGILWLCERSFHWGKTTMLHILESHKIAGIPFDTAIRYEIAVLKGKIPRG